MSWCYITMAAGFHEAVLSGARRARTNPVLRRLRSPAWKPATPDLFITSLNEENIGARLELDEAAIVVENRI